MSMQTYCKYAVQERWRFAWCIRSHRLPSESGVKGLQATSARASVRPQL